MFHSFVERLKNRLNTELPGEDIQFLMAPTTRERIHQAKQKNYNPKLSAVLILLYPSENTVNTVLMQRPEYDGVHSGQIAFPGGGQEERDASLRETALREASEEVGVDPSKIEIIGNLTDIYILPSNYLVTPFIGITHAVPQFIADPLEVQQIVETDVMKLNDDSIKGNKIITQSGGFQLKTPYYEIEGFTVWGATAMMISELNAVVKESIISF